jgi:hypothetical protein
MLLSGNAEVGFPSRTTTIAVPNLPTPATAAATSASNVAAAVAALVPTTAAASVISVSAIDIVATPTVVRKRQARP